MCNKANCLPYPRDTECRGQLEVLNLLMLLKILLKPCRLNVCIIIGQIRLEMVDSIIIPLKRGHIFLYSVNNSQLQIVVASCVWYFFRSSHAFFIYLLLLPLWKYKVWEGVWRDSEFMLRIIVYFTLFAIS